MTVVKCWEELEPVCRELARLVYSAPLPPNEKAGLALIYLTQAIGVAAAEQQHWKGGSLESNARSMVDLAMVAAFPPHPPARKLVGGDEP